MEACRIRVKDLDFDRKQLIVRDGKHGKDRYLPLPQLLGDPLREQVRKVYPGAEWCKEPTVFTLAFPARCSGLRRKADLVAISEKYRFFLHLAVKEPNRHWQRLSISTKLPTCRDSTAVR